MYCTNYKQIVAVAKLTDLKYQARFESCWRNAAWKRLRKICFFLLQLVLYACKPYWTTVCESGTETVKQFKNIWTEVLSTLFWATYSFSDVAFQIIQFSNVLNVHLWQLFSYRCINNYYDACSKNVFHCVLCVHCC